ncbi:MAG TPA: YncE family protein, partial [Verrucomicrobiae bacterium]|nr:YncE family protein [Verrucomicrobiae bacterium]
RLFAVNTPDDRLSVFDVSNPQNPILIAEIPVALEPVSVNPVNNDEAWVVNELSDSVTVVSVSRHVITDTIYVKDEPGDVVFANGRAFVSASRNNRITVIDQASHAVVTNIPVFGEHPRALAVSADGTRVYAAFALSGNRTTLVPFSNPNVPPQPTDGMKPGLPAPPRVSLIVDANDPAWNPSFIKFSMPDNDVVEIDTSTLAITRYFPRVGTVNLGLAVRPNSGDLYVANTDARNASSQRFEPVIRGSFVTNQVSRVDITSGAVTRFNLNTNANTVTNFPSLSDLTNALAQPTAIVFGPSGANFYVAAFGSDRVAQVDANSGAVVARIELSPTATGSAADPRNKRGPRGLAIKPGQALYVLNRLANSITVISPTNHTVVREIPIGSHDPTPTAVRNGRGFLYDAKLSGAGLVSCASCHIDSEMDHLAWDLGNPQGNLETNQAVISASKLLIPGGLSSNFVFHPMKGPMTTQTLKGLQGLDPLHWRGDRTNFLHFNGAFDGLLGGTVLSATDMQAYRTYINTIAFEPNPNQNLDRTLPASFAGGNPVVGRNTFLFTNYQGSGVLGLKCNTCHAVPNGTDKSFTPAAALQEPQSFKVPHLRAIYQKMRFTNAPGASSIGGFGIIHDGTDPDLQTFLSRSVFGVFAEQTPAGATIRSNINAFVQCFDTGTAPAVGYARTLTADGVDTASVSNDWNLLESQAALQTNINLVVKGTIDGFQHGLLYQPASGNYRLDTATMAPMTRSQLRSKVLAGDTLTILGVPPGSGTRIGIDRNENGVLDGDEPRPSLRIASANGRTIVAWPTNRAGYVLERATNLPSTSWNTDTSVRGLVGGEFNITNWLTSSNLFFRLREL